MVKWIFIRNEMLLIMAYKNITIATGEESEREIVTSRDKKIPKLLNLLFDPLI